MTPQNLAAIKERYEKIYIIADEAQHKLLSTMKQDILDLIAHVESQNVSGYKTFTDVDDLVESK